jgi:hypothetical protein
MALMTVTHPNPCAVAEFLCQNPDIDYNNPMIGKMLVTGVFDSHTYSIHMMLGDLIKYPIKWIPLDIKIEMLSTVLGLLLFLYTCIS